MAKLHIKNQLIFHKLAYIRILTVFAKKPNALGRFFLTTHPTRLMQLQFSKMLRM
jgi:hypothetical protein